MFISILSTCFEGKILIAFTWLFQLDNKKAEMEGKVRIRFLLPSTCETCQIFDSHCSKTTGRQKEPLFWTGTGRGRCIYPQRPLLFQRNFRQHLAIVLCSAVLPPIIKIHLPQIAVSTTPAE